ncbi:MAG: TIGR00730 family Rossman fold protein [Myxococcota bacterium]|nr:TIGR00730 family Rossman fold protein [Myxococcota bacterium]
MSQQPESMGVELPPELAKDPEALERVRRIMESPSYRLAEQDLDLLAREETTPVRLLLEYLKPQMALREEGIRSTIVLFGGTRIIEPAAARRQLEEARAASAAAPGDAALEQRMRIAERVEAKSHYYDVAREFAERISRASQRELQRDYVIVTGGGPGVMEAGNRGAADVGAKSIGLNITLPREQFPNSYITPELCFQFHYFALRKMHFLRLAAGLVAFPGGYGTLDELFDTLCLIQTRKMDPVPVVLVGEAFWRGMIDFDHMVAEGVIAPRDVELVSYAETADDIMKRLEDWYGLAPDEEARPEILAERRRQAAAAWNAS